MQNSKKRLKKKTLSYADIQDIVEYLVKVKSQTYTFDCYTTEDIGQEIRIICLKALEHFDMSRVSEEKLVNFFGRCVDNALKNLKRDKYIRASSPCLDCEHLHSESDDLQKICKRWIKFKKNLNRRISIKHPLNIEIVGDIRDFNTEEDVDVEDLKAFLLKKIDVNLRKSLKVLFYGNPDDVPLKERRLIQSFIKNVLEE